MGQQIVPDLSNSKGSLKQIWNMYFWWEFIKSTWEDNVDQTESLTGQYKGWTVLVFVFFWRLMKILEKNNDGSNHIVFIICLLYPNFRKPGK